MSALVHQVRLFFVALQFFTRVPVPGWIGFDPAWLHQCTRYFPLVGLGVGGAAAGVYFAASLVWPAPVAALLSTAAGIYLTGAFHEDGFADMCDGFGGGITRERVFEIMKDSRLGTYGTVGAGLIIALKCTLLAMLPPATAIAALLLAHPLSRLAAASLIWQLDYAKDEGKAKPMGQEMTGPEFAIACACGLLPGVVLAALGLLLWPVVAGAALAAFAAAVWLGAKCVARIGGYTGDCLGAVQQLAEVAIYLCVVAGLQQGAWH